MKRSLLFVAATTLSVVAGATEFNNADICKATIAIEMGRSTTGMKQGKPSADNVTIYYVRADDGQTFRYRCKFEGSTVVWSTYFTDTSSWGRWHNSYVEGDAKTTYAINSDRLTVSNDQIDQKHFSKADF